MFARLWMRLVFIKPFPSLVRKVGTSDKCCAVQAWVAVFGVVLSSGVGLFFGIYPALRASRLDPVIAMRSE